MTPAPAKPWTFENMRGAAREICLTRYGFTGIQSLFAWAYPNRPKTHDEWMMRHHLYHRWKELARHA